MADHVLEIATRHLRVILNHVYTGHRPGGPYGSVILAHDEAAHVPLIVVPTTSELGEPVTLDVSSGQLHELRWGGRDHMRARAAVKACHLNPSRLGLDGPPDAWIINNGRAVWWQPSVALLYHAPLDRSGNPSWLHAEVLCTHASDPCDHGPLKAATQALAKVSQSPTAEVT